MTAGIGIVLPGMRGMGNPSFRTSAGLDGLTLSRAAPRGGRGPRVRDAGTRSDCRVAFVRRLVLADQFD